MRRCPRLKEVLGSKPTALDIVRGRRNPPVANGGPSPRPVSPLHEPPTRVVNVSVTGVTISPPIRNCWYCPRSGARSRAVRLDSPTITENLSLQRRLHAADHGGEKRDGPVWDDYSTVAGYGPLPPPSQEIWDKPSSAALRPVFAPWCVLQREAFRLKPSILSTTDLPT